MPKGNERNINISFSYAARGKFSTTPSNETPTDLLLMVNAENCVKKEGR